MIGRGGERGQDCGQQKSQPIEQAAEDTMGRSAAARQTAADQFMEAPMLKTNDLSSLSSKATPSLRLSR